MRFSRRRSVRALAVVVSVALLAASPALADEAADAAAADAAPADAAGGSTLDAWAQGGAKAFDVIPIRLLSTCAVIIGAGAFLVSVPLVGPGFQLEGIRSSWDYFVMGPYEYTFVRPLGDF